jgi:phytoene dehydrogenase-like protein
MGLQSPLPPDARERAPVPLVDRLDMPGGRAAVRKQEGFTFHRTAFADGTHPGAGVPGVLSCAKAPDGIVPAPAGVSHA